jgi:phosphatidylcholine synthase
MKISPAQPNVALAWFVHFYTACGAVAAFLAAIAVVESRYREAFLWMMGATLIDATDGALARVARVNDVLPSFDGARLDDIVDYLTFVFVPILLLYRAGALPAGWALAVASAVLLSSAYGFASADAKTHDHFFTGFPSYWNVVALYLYAAALGPVFNAITLLMLSALVFVRVGYVYPSRTPVLRTTTILLGLLWGGMLLAIIVVFPHPSKALLIASVFFPIYSAVLSIALHARRRARGGRP